MLFFPLGNFTRAAPLFEIESPQISSCFVVGIKCLHAAIDADLCTKEAE